MIRFLRGILAQKTDNCAVVEQSGVGFEVWISLMTYRDLPKVGEPLTLHTYMLVKEDDIRLYGFSTTAEREVFLVLLGLSGVGAKMAMDVMSHVSHEQLVQSIQNNEPAVLCQVPGIGKKRAEKILFDLQRLKSPVLLGAATQKVAAGGEKAPVLQNAQEALDALQALGLKPQEAHKAVNGAIETLGENAAVADLIKEGLRNR